MLYHPQSPYFAQFLQSGSRYNKRMDGAIGASTPAPSNASAAQAKAANMEKWAAIQLLEKTLIEPIAWRMTKNIERFDKKDRLRAKNTTFSQNRSNQWKPNYY